MEKKLFKATYALPQTVISEGQALTRFIVTPDFKIALRLADDNKKGLELAKVEFAEKDVITFAEERDALILILCWAYSDGDWMGGAWKGLGTSKAGFDIALLMPVLSSICSVPSCRRCWQ